MFTLLFDFVSRCARDPTPTSHRVQLCAFRGNSVAQKIPFTIDGTTRVRPHHLTRENGERKKRRPVLPVTSRTLSQKHTPRGDAGNVLPTERDARFALFAREFNFRSSSPEKERERERERGRGRKRDRDYAWEDCRNNRARRSVGREKRERGRYVYIYICKKKRR